MARSLDILGVPQELQTFSTPYAHSCCSITGVQPGRSFPGVLGGRNVNVPESWDLQLPTGIE